MEQRISFKINEWKKKYIYMMILVNVNFVIILNNTRQVVDHDVISAKLHELPNVSNIHQLTISMPVATEI